MHPRQDNRELGRNPPTNHSTRRKIYGSSAGMLPTITELKKVKEPKKKRAESERDIGLGGNIWQAETRSLVDSNGVVCPIAEKSAYIGDFDPAAVTFGGMLAPAGPLPKK